MKRLTILKLLLFSWAIVLLLTTCTNPTLEVDQDIENDPNSVTVTGSLTGNEIWGPPNTYILNGMVVVPYGKTLCIEPGTIIKASDKLISGLHVERGGTLCANGTAQNPIVFTTIKQPGSRKHSSWGGISICGYAPNTIDPDAELFEYKYLPRNNDFNYQYGEGGILDPHQGIDPTQGNLGTILRFVRIEYAGRDISVDNEFDALVIASVGSNAVLDHIMITHSGEDSYSFRGGSVFAKYLISYACIDDDFELADGFNGRIQYAFVQRDPANSCLSGSHALEIKVSNLEGVVPNTNSSNAILSNFTVVGPLFVDPLGYYTHNTYIHSNFRQAIFFKNSSNLSLYNSLILGYGEYLWRNNSSILNGNTGPSIRNSVLVSGLIGLYDQHLIDTSSLIINADSIIGMQTFGILPGSFANSNPIQSSASISPMQLTSSPYLIGAAPLPGFEPVSFLGAMGSTEGNWNWNSNWVNFNPQNAPY